MKKWGLLIGIIILIGILVGVCLANKKALENENTLEEIPDEVVSPVEENVKEFEGETKEETIEVEPETTEKKDEEPESPKEMEEKKVEIIEAEVVPVSTNNLSNQICAWGFVRGKDGKKPEFYGPHAKVLDAYKGIYCAKTEEPIIYLTFDEGYENGYTASILDTLKEKNVTSIFFVTMPYVKQNPDLVRRMIEEGHLVGNHTVNHPSMPEVTSDEKLTREIMDLHDYVKENFNYEMTFLRPPKGEYSERTVKLALDLGYRTVLWSAAYDDWDTSKQDRLNYARGMILNNLHPGEVMLLHAVSKDNAALLGEVIDEARNQGYEFVSLEEF